jgi:hypothetical protein
VAARPNKKRKWEQNIVKMPGIVDKSMVAPCGVSCFACYARFPKRKEPCHGCRAPEEQITRDSCKRCEIRSCVQERGVTFCAECEDFPCRMLKPLHRRYKSIQKIDLEENGREAARDITAFLAKQKERYTCKHCGGIINMHYAVCSDCGKKEE